MNKMLSFRELLSRHMTTNRFTSSRLASKINVAGITVKRWLAGEHDLTYDNVEKPRRKHVVAIAKIFKLTLEERDELLLSAGYPPEFFLDPADYKQSSPKPRTKPEPFPTPGKPIHHPSQFFGRVDILARIQNSVWRQPEALQHFALVGKRCSGKTSFLNYLKNIGQISKTDLRDDQPQGWEDWLPTDFQFVSVDFRLTSMRKPESLLRLILEQLRLQIPTPCDVVNFSITLNERLQKPTVILMDEIGVGLQASDLDKEFWWNLRELGGNCADGRLGFVVTAHEPVEKLAEDYGKPSPFFGIFGHTLSLDALTETEALDLVKNFSPSIDNKDAAWILQESGRWPVMLQILCEVRIRTLEKGDSSDAWKTEGQEKIKPYLYLNEE